MREKVHKLEKTISTTLEAVKALLNCSLEKNLLELVCDQTMQGNK